MSFEGGVGVMMAKQERLALKQLEQAAEQVLKENPNNELARWVLDVIRAGTPVPPRLP